MSVTNMLLSFRVLCSGADGNVAAGVILFFPDRPDKVSPVCGLFPPPRGGGPGLFFQGWTGQMILRGPRTAPV